MSLIQSFTRLRSPISVKYRYFYLNVAATPGHQLPCLISERHTTAWTIEQDMTAQCLPCIAHTSLCLPHLLTSALALSCPSLKVNLILQNMLNLSSNSLYLSEWTKNNSLSTLLNELDHRQIVKSCWRRSLLKQRRAVSDRTILQTRLFVS